MSSFVYQARRLASILLFFPAAIWAQPAAETFGTLPNVYDAAISPDARQVAIISNLDGPYGVRVINWQDDNLTQRAVYLGNEVKPMWIKWANNDRILIGTWQSSFVAGTPITSSYIYTLDAQSMKGRYLVAPRRVFRQDNSDVIDFLPEDPDHILMAFSTVDQIVADIRKVNVATGKHRKIKRGRSYIQSWYTDHRGEPRIGQGLSPKAQGTEDWHLTIRDADEDKWREVDEYPGLSPDVSIFGFTQDPNELIVGDYAGKDTLGLYVYDLKQKQVTRSLFHHDDYDAGGVVVNSETHEVIGARYVAESAEVTLFAGYDSLMERMRRRFENYTVSYVDQSADGQTLLFKVSDASFPGVLAMVSVNDSEPTILTHYRPELTEIKLGQVIPVGYVSRDKQRIPAYITLPPAVTSEDQVRDMPFIVLPHGGPYARSSHQFDNFAQFFASRGFGVLQMNFRGSSGYGKSFEDTGRNDWVVMQEDVTDGAKWLIEKGYADPDRICIAGWSYGGYAALMGAIKHPDLYACAVSMAGVTDLRDLVRDIRKYRFGRLSARQFVQDGFESMDGMLTNSPVERASELQVPLFLAHGTRDERVHFDQFKRMRFALRKSTTETTFVKFDDEDHFLSKQDNRQTFYARLDAFLAETVGKSEFAH